MPRQCWPEGSSLPRQYKNITGNFKLSQLLKDAQGRLARFLAPTNLRAKSAILKTLLLPLKRALPGPMDHLGDKADLTPSPLKGQAATGAV